MSGGTGVGFIDDGIGAVTNLATGGLVGYGDGGFKGGVTVDGIKEVTGARAAEKANDLARDQFNETKAAAELDRQNKVTQNYRDQVTASNAAGLRGASAFGARSSTTASNNNKTSSSFIGDLSDFLGI